MHDHDHNIFGGVDDFSFTRRDGHGQREKDGSGKDQHADDDALVEAVATGGASASYTSYRTRDPFHVRMLYLPCLVSYNTLGNNLDLSPFVITFLRSIFSRITEKRSLDSRTAWPFVDEFCGDF